MHTQDLHQLKKHIFWGSAVAKPVRSCFGARNKMKVCIIGKERLMKIFRILSPYHVHCNMVRSLLDASFQNLNDSKI